MPAGRELTERHLHAFRMWGVADLDIEGDGPAEEPEAAFGEDVLEQADREVGDLFVNAGPQHPFLDALREIARERIARQIVDGRGGAS